jgi:chemotaxis protein histidine kinase CheA
MVVAGPVLTGRLLTFRVGPGRYAVLLEDVLAVQDPAESGAGADRGVAFHGRPVAALDARALWWSALGPLAPETSPAIIVVGRGGGSTALVVDRVEGIVEGVEMRPLPALVEPFVRNVFSGVTLHADGDRLLVDTAALAGGQGGPGEA